MKKQVLIVGWFSFEKCKATAGDIMACDLIGEWVSQAGYDYQVALAPPFVGGVNCLTEDPNDYSHLVFVCGPFGRGKEVLTLLRRFSNCRLIGIDLSVLDSPDVWNPFDVLIERDSVLTARPDITFLSTQTKAPVVGVILAHVQEEYGSKSKHLVANEAIKKLLSSNNAAAVYIDTCLDPNLTNLKNPSEVEALISKMDLIVTTRLHGTVLALKNGIPVIAIDAVSKGSKVSKQARVIDWPLLFSTDDLDAQKLQSAFNYCQTEEAKKLAVKCCNHAMKEVEYIKQKFVDSLNLSSSETMRVDNLSVENKFETIDKKIMRKLKGKQNNLRGYIRGKIHSIGHWLLNLNF